MDEQQQKEIIKLKKQLYRLETGKPGSGGGGRNGGRKKLLIPKVQCFVYIEENKIEALGGRHATQNFMNDAVNLEYEKLKNA